MSRPPNCYRGFALAGAWNFSSGSKYRRLQILLDRQFAEGFQLRAAYTLGTATFGRVTSARDARIGQMALKLIW